MAGDFKSKIEKLIGAELVFTTYVKLATFSNPSGSSFHFRKKGIACSPAWAKFIRRIARFSRTII